MSELEVMHKAIKELSKHDKNVVDMFAKQMRTQLNRGGKLALMGLTLVAAEIMDADKGLPSFRK